MSKQTLLYQGPVATRSGYGDHARDVLYSLRALDKFDIKIVSTKWGNTPMDALQYSNEFHKWIFDNLATQEQITQKPDVYVQVSVANEFQPVGYYNIGITAGIETTQAPPEWIIGCNRMDLIIVPSEHSKNTIANIMYNEADKNTGQMIKQHKLEKPIEVVFEGYNEQSYNESNIQTIRELDSIKENFCFLYVGHWLKGNFGEDRKNISMLLRTFAITFKNETTKPALILKTSHAGFSVRDREEIIRKIKACLADDFSKIPVYLLHGDLTDTEMNSLYRHEKVKAMVSFTKGEGFGRPLLEFSLTGKPVIASNWSGHIDFLKEGAILLEGQLKEVHESAADQFLLKESKWFNVNITSAIPKLKDVYKNYASYKKYSEKLSIVNIELFSLEKMTKLIGLICEKYELYNKIKPKMQELKLPKLKMLNKQ